MCYSKVTLLSSGFWAGVNDDGRRTFHRRRGIGGRMADEPRLREEGREIADEIAACYWEVEVTGQYDRREECEERAAEAGLRRLDAGTKRTVYAVPDELVAGERSCILKIAHSLLGYYENRGEVSWWSRMPGEAREYFAPVLDHDPGWEGTDHACRWVVMPDADRDLTREERREVWFNLGDVRFVGEDVEDAHQLGRIDGDPVIIDYGRGDFIRRGEHFHNIHRVGGDGDDGDARDG